MSDVRLKNDEVVTGATFLKTNFLLDRKEIEVVFPEFDSAYEAYYLNQIKVVKKLDRKYAKTQEQKKASEALYGFSDGLNTEMNALAFKFKSAGVDGFVITALKKKFKSLDMEGALDLMDDLVGVVEDNLEVLQPKGVSKEYLDSLYVKKDQLLQFNEKQNEVIDQGEKLTDVNQKEYDKLRKMISKIIGAGKIVFAAEKRADFYNLTKLIARMRSGNGGKDNEEGEN